MKALLSWLDDRTGYRAFMHDALYENVPGGSRWRYVWGSTLVFCFFMQVITGIVLWMCYSPSAQTAWESVYFIEYHVPGGSLLRGIHHFTAQAMVVLLAIHLLQVVIDGAYRAPREINFWLGLILMQIVLGLSLTGYLLPWDQKGYWATKVATRIAGLTPLVGPQLEQLIVGGSDYGHHTLTRFFALHAGVLPGLLIFFLVFHVTFFRRHSITAKISKKKPRPDQAFWPDQVLKDAIACLAVLVAVILLSVYLRAELGAPADPANAYSAARPEWYFRFLFQFLKFFHGETGEIIGAIIVPGAIVASMFLMPFIGRGKGGHWANVSFILLLLVGSAALTVLSLEEDYQAGWIDEKEFADVTNIVEEIEIDLRRNGADSKYSGKSEKDCIAAYFDGNDEGLKKFQPRWIAYQQFAASRDFLDAVADAHDDGERTRELARQRIPPAGALSMLRADAKTQGPKLFARYCAACHDHVDEQGQGISQLRPLEYQKSEDGKRKPVPSGAPNLYRFASRAWLGGLLDPEKIAAVHYDVDTLQVTGAPYFGNTSHKKGDMAGFVDENLGDLEDDEKADLKKLVVALSAEAELPYQKLLDEAAHKEGTIKQGAEAIVDAFACIDCHKFHDEEGNDAPDLTGYGSRQWTIDFVNNPAHARFYGKENERMPAFADPKKSHRSHVLSTQQIELIVDWIRQDWFEPGDAE